MISSLAPPPKELQGKNFNKITFPGFRPASSAGGFLCEPKGACAHAGSRGVGGLGQGAAELSQGWGTHKMRTKEILFPGETHGMTDAPEKEKGGGGIKHLNGGNTQMWTPPVCLPFPN